MITSKYVSTSTLSRLFLVAMVTGSPALAQDTSVSENSAGVTESTDTNARVLKGVALVNDGDSLSIDNQLVNLYGIDAPEKKQRCSNEDGLVYRCGQFSISFLTSLLGNEEISCEILPSKKKSVSTGRCSTASIPDISIELAKSGYAWSDFKHPEINEAMNEAVNAKKGIWKGHSNAPWIWRKMKKAGIIFPAKGG